MEFAQRSTPLVQEALARDSECAIAGWGIAAALIGNTFATGPNPAQASRAKEAIERARAASRKTERELNFIEAVAQYYDLYPGRPHAQRMKALASWARGGTATPGFCGDRHRAAPLATNGICLAPIRSGSTL